MACVDWLRLGCSDQSLSKKLGFMYWLRFSSSAIHVQAQGCCYKWGSEVMGDRRQPPFLLSLERTKDFMVNLRVNFYDDSFYCIAWFPQNLAIQKEMAPQTLKSPQIQDKKCLQFPYLKTEWISQHSLEEWMRFRVSWGHPLQVGHLTSWSDHSSGTGSAPAPSGLRLTTAAFQMPTVVLGAGAHHGPNANSVKCQEPRHRVLSVELDREAVFNFKMYHWSNFLHEERKERLREPFQIILYNYQMVLIEGANETCNDSPPFLLSSLLLSWVKCKAHQFFL